MNEITFALLFMILLLCIAVYLACRHKVDKESIEALKLRLELYKSMKEIIDFGGGGFCNALRLNLGFNPESKGIRSIEDLPELMEYKPRAHKSVNQLFWFPPSDKKTRIDILDKCIKITAFKLHQKGYEPKPNEEINPTSRKRRLKKVIIAELPRLIPILLQLITIAFLGITLIVNIVSINNRIKAIEKRQSEISDSIRYSILQIGDVKQF